ncbi:DMT family transporter [Marmoricola sp. URHB0036]|uniref:DMT family transporter n=1 Tax=Marmoricola sp. URHB0036 TaxID=1298863 RepID=UPI000425BDD8|nr:DMT family transporter [Marmoricola sp. URHB0036]
MQLGTLFGLGAALAFGLCDFVAGIASRWISFWWVTLASLGASVAGAWVIVAVRGDGAADQDALGWGVAAGVGAAVGATALYRGYGHGQMAVAGPLSAVGAAALPAVVGALLGDRLPAYGIVGVVLALPAIWMMAGGGEGADSVRAGVPGGLLSGAGFALEFVGLERAGGGSGLLPVAISQTTAMVLVALVVATVHPPWRRSSRAFSLAVLAGLLSLVATAAYFGAAHEGMLTVAAVLASVYPGVTVALAAVFLHERPGRRQLLGLALGAVAVVLIATS